MEPTIDPIHTDHYGRAVPRPAYGSTRLDCPTNMFSVIAKAAARLFDAIADKWLPIRRITIAGNKIVPDDGFQQYIFWPMWRGLTREKLQTVMTGLKKKYGKNRILKGTNYLEGATMREGQ